MLLLWGSIQTKKAGRLPMPAYVGSSKNLLPERQRNAQQDTETQWSLLVYFDSTAKGLVGKLGWFTCPFAEITDTMSSELSFHVGGRLFQPIIYPRFGESQVPKQESFHLFYKCYRGKLCRYDSAIVLSFFSNVALRAWSCRVE